MSLPKHLLLLGSFVACAASAEPLELNPNAQFDLDVAGVALASAPAGGVVAWTPADLGGRLGSGALRVSGPAGAYQLSTCARVPSLPWAEYAYALSVKLRTLGAPATAHGEVVLMFGGDDPLLDGACARAAAGYAAAYAFPAPEAELSARIARGLLVTDASQRLVLHKGDADVLIDAWSLTIDADPLTADGFE